MSYLALARKYRPRRFADVLGQEPVVRALRHALEQDRLHPAILLTGTRGVGKTTLARIVAKGLNCERGVAAEACGECPACREVDEGRFVDLLEIDAASHTGVDHVRELIDNAQYPAARGRYKVYLIDEVHMLSKAAFNALLKTLEEPPAHVKFILATTDPQKMPITVLSRCLQFGLRRLPDTLIRERLAAVLAEEGIQAEDEALAEIARAADGSMRDALSLLDQAIACAGGEPLDRAVVEQMIGSAGRRELVALIAALADGDRFGLKRLFAELAERAPDYDALLHTLGAFLQRIAVLQLLPDAEEEDSDGLRPLARRIPPEQVQLWYQICVLGRRDQPWAPSPRAGFEMTVLRMLAFAPDDGPPAGAGGASRGKAGGTGSAGRNAPAPEASPAPQAGAGGQDWAAVAEALAVDGLVRQLALRCELVGAERGRWRLRLDAEFAHLLDDERRAVLEQALSRHQRGPVQLQIEVGAVQRTPARERERQEQRRRRDAIAALTADPVVRALVETFDAELLPESIEFVEQDQEDRRCSR